MEGGAYGHCSFPIPTEVAHHVVITGENGHLSGFRKKYDATLSEIRDYP
jgi:hypothetical protein